jgi:hypothetical protein
LSRINRIDWYNFDFAMTELDIRALFSQLAELAGDELDDRLPTEIHRMKSQGLEVRVEVAQDDPIFISDPAPYAELTQRCQVWIGMHKVYEWLEIYRGTRGGIDPDWWVDQSDTSIDANVRVLLELLVLMPSWPCFPQLDEYR